MKYGEFMHLIADDYDNIISIIVSRSVKCYNMDFDEDIFGESFIKCAQRFGEEKISYDDAIKYFWVVYLNGMKSKFIADSKINHINIEEFEEDYTEKSIEEHLIYKESDLEKSEFYNRVMDAISEEFGEEDMHLYRLYKHHNWTLEEISNIGISCSNFSDRIKAINKFIKTFKNTKKKKSH